MKRMRTALRCCYRFYQEMHPVAVWTLAAGFTLCAGCFSAAIFILHEPQCLPSPADALRFSRELSESGSGCLFVGTFLAAGFDIVSKYIKIQ